MKTKDIILALQCCAEENCGSCPTNRNYPQCQASLITFAASRMTEQQTRIQFLENDIAKLKNEKSWAEEIAMSDRRRDFW